MMLLSFIFVGFRGLFLQMAAKAIFYGRSRRHCRVLQVATVVARNTLTLLYLQAE
jgi:hypothetical protein